MIPLPCTTVRDLLAIFVLLLTGACVPTFPTMPGQEEAIAIVWRQQYAVFEHEAPRVDWVTQPRLTCQIGDEGQYVGFNENESTCVAGLSWSDTNLVRLAFPDLTDPMTISRSSFPHELYHLALYARTGDADHEHAAPGWDTEVSAARAALAAGGL